MLIIGAEEDEIMWRSKIIIAITALTAVGMVMAADDNGPPRKDGVAAARDVAALGVVTPQENDRRIARWLDVDNESMIACTQLAESHAHNPAIKDLARTLNADHKRMQERLKAFTRYAVPAADVERAAVPVNATATLLRDEGRSRDGRLTFAPTDFLQIKEIVCKELRAKAEKEFENLKGAEFDHAFMAHMQFGHEAMLANLNAVKGGASQQLQTTLDEFRQSTEQHLKNVRQLNQHQQVDFDRRATTPVNEK